MPIILALVFINIPKIIRVFFDIIYKILTNLEIMFTDVQVQNLVDRVNQKYDVFGKEPSSCNILSTSGRVTRMIKDNFPYEGHNLREFQLREDIIVALFFASNAHAYVAQMINTSPLKTYVFFREGFGLQAKYISKYVRDISKVDFYEIGYDVCNNPDPRCPYINPKDLVKIITPTKPKVSLDLARTLFKEAGLYKVETPFI